MKFIPHVSCFIVLSSLRSHSRQGEVGVGRGLVFGENGKPHVFVSLLIMQTENNNSRHNSRFSSSGDLMTKLLLAIQTGGGGSRFY